jgi:hypothetical protein
MKLINISNADNLISSDISNYQFDISPTSLKKSDLSKYFNFRDKEYKKTGYIIVSGNNNEIRSFKFNDVMKVFPVGKNKINVISADDAKNKVTIFIKEVFPTFTDTDKLTVSPKMDRYGRYTCSLRNTVDEKTTGIDVKVDFEGYVVAFEMIGMGGDETKIDPGNVITHSVVAESPAWSTIVPKLWWSSNARWDFMPPWMQESPSSIAHKLLPEGNIFLYRPLVDHLPVSIAYKLPSPSPDSKWMGGLIYPNIPVVVNCLANRLDCMPVNHQMKQRMSWSADSNNLAFVDSATLQAYRIQVMGKTSLPLDNPEIQLFDDAQCAAIEYLPGSNDRMIAVYREWVQRDDPEAWQIVQVYAGEKKTIISKTFSDGLQCPEKMHINPDGKSLLISYPTGVWSINLETYKKEKIAWLANGAKIGDDAIIDTANLDWAVSPDMKTIAFSARGIKDKNSSYIYTADLAGTNIKNQTPTNLDEIFKRYMPNGYVVVPKESISVRLAERMHYIPVIEWSDEKPDEKIEK